MVLQAPPFSYFHNQTGFPTLLMGTCQVAPFRLSTCGFEQLHPWEASLFQSLALFQGIYRDIAGNLQRHCWVSPSAFSLFCPVETFFFKMHPPFFNGAHSTGFGSVTATFFKVACSWAYSKLARLARQKALPASALAN